jgi:hypothetical protein
MIARIKQNPFLLAIAILAIIAALAFAWWTISPLFIRTTLVEGQNISVPAVTETSTPTAVMERNTPTAVMESEEVMAPTSTPEPSGAMDPTPTPEASDAMPESGPTILATGSFDRKDDVHYASGQAILAREADGTVVLRLQDLDSANGPDLYVYVSQHPNPQTSEELHQGGHNLGTLKATTGSFNYTLDPSIDPSQIKSVVIYCRAFSVLFSTAALQTP